MKTHHKLIFGDAEDMRELEDGSIQLVITSPPYFNAPFDYPDLFESYEAYMEKMRRVTKVGALGGIKPLSLFAYRFNAYEGFIRWLNEENLKFYDLIHDFILEQGVKELFRFLSSHPVLEAGWVGNDPKACRMFVNWVVFLFGEIFGFEEVRLEDTLMIVDGHVGKVFCRTGLLGEVLYEKKRPYIIQASKMRSAIEQIVSQAGMIPFYVDNGAFYLYEDGYCKDLEPYCEACPVQGICKRYIKWTAYQIFRQS